MWARAICRTLRWSTGWNGTCGCRRCRPRICWRSSGRPSNPIGKTENSSPTGRRRTGNGCVRRSTSRPANANADRLTVTLSGLEVHPKPFQAEMLEELDAERRSARSASQPDRRGDWHRQDRHRRAGLSPAGARDPRPRPDAAVRGPPQGDSARSLGGCIRRC